MLADHLKNPSTDVSNQDFAEQVRGERLSIIWKATLAVSVAVLWIFVLFSSDMARDGFAPCAIAVVACLLCRFFLVRNQLQTATWSYATGMLLAIGMLLTNNDDTVREIVPFATLLVMFIAGLLLPTRAIIGLTLASIAIILIAPWIGDGEVAAPTAGQSLAMLMVFLSALIIAQASGELYGIAEWALESYRRERDGAVRLFESRQQVERSLQRQQAMTTELKTMNDELAEARRAADEAKHFRGQFLANMSHELRTPLNAVIGFSETMLNFPPMYNNIELPEEYRRDLNQINSSGKHLLNIINDILDLSKIDAGRLEVDMQKVELDPIFKGVLSTAVGLVGGKPVKLLRDIPAGIPDVAGDPVRIRQVLLNLYSNAAKFTEAGSVTLAARYNDDEVIVSLTDTGEGIPPDAQDLIFEEFRQSTSGRKKARAGAGLGLAISRQLLALMNGRIWVESEVGKGSTFYFALPRYKEEPSTPVPANNLESA